MTNDIKLIITIRGPQRWSRPAAEHVRRLIKIALPGILNGPLGMFKYPANLILPDDWQKVQVLWSIEEGGIIRESGNSSEMPKV